MSICNGSHSCFNLQKDCYCARCKSRVMMLLDQYGFCVIYHIVNLMSICGCENNNEEVTEYTTNPGNWKARRKRSMVA
jgi:hypothetical protein